jgi:hypothetical protein
MISMIELRLIEIIFINLGALTIFEDVSGRCAEKGRSSGHPRNNISSFQMANSTCLLWQLYLIPFDRIPSNGTVNENSPRQIVASLDRFPCSTIPFRPPFRKRKTKSREQSSIFHFRSSDHCLLPLCYEDIHVPL